MLTSWKSNVTIQTNKDTVGRNQFSSHLLNVELARMLSCNRMLVFRCRVSHVGRWGRRSSTCCPQYTPPEALRPGCSLYHTGTPQRALCSGCVLALCRAALASGCRSLWPLTREIMIQIKWFEQKQRVTKAVMWILIRPFSIRSHVGAGRLHVPLAWQKSVFGPASCRPALHT